MKIKKVKLDAISQDPANLRKHGERNIDAIVASLRKFGQQHPIVIDSRGIILSGNGRYMAAVKLGWQEIEVVESSLTGSSATAYAIADNRTAELAEWDTTALAETLRALQSEEFDTDAAGYSESEIDALVEGLGSELLAGDKEIIEDEVPEPPVDPITKAGDLWILGEHRLLCGDSTNADDVARLMDGKKADLCLTDPPYGLGDSVSDKNKYDLYEDSKKNLIRTVEGFFPIAQKISKTVVLTPGNANQRFYPNPEWTMAWFTPAGAGSGPWGFCCWQPILCYGKDPKLAKCLGRHPDAIVHTESAEKNSHPCPKPIGFWKWLMERTSEPESAIYEPFCGSGTTLIAAEQLNRKCYGMEISPQYCDVIVKRWENLTGMVAVREPSLPPVEKQ